MCALPFPHGAGNLYTRSRSVVSVSVSVYMTVCTGRVYNGVYTRVLPSTPCFTMLLHAFPRFYAFTPFILYAVYALRLIMSLLLVLPLVLLLSRQFYTFPTSFIAFTCYTAFTEFKLK